MKNILKIFIIAAGFVLFFNANSFALVDVAAYGGYVFGGDAGGTDFDGPQYGVKAHYNTSFALLFDLGVGAYFQQSKIKYDGSTKRKSADSTGLDVSLIFSIVPIIHPYARGTWAFWDKTEDHKDNFKAYGLGAGVELTVFPFVRLFGEYMYNRSKHESVKFTSNAINAGLKVDF